MRESPGLVIIELLQQRGVQVDYYDPYCTVIPRTREHARLAGMRSVLPNAATLAAYDAALIVTDHDRVDYQALVDNCRLVIDTRNATHNVGHGLTRVVRA